MVWVLLAWCEGGLGGVGEWRGKECGGTHVLDLTPIIFGAPARTCGTAAGLFGTEVLYLYTARAVAAFVRMTMSRTV